ncbi:hypothetical protein CSPX01_03165 [Colletotrichum filicis]|nr:hypothetical protein CSPX01_03165 [Colletotrichum filicis]
MSNKSTARAGSQIHWNGLLPDVCTATEPAYAIEKPIHSSSRPGEILRFSKPDVFISKRR